MVGWFAVVSAKRQTSLVQQPPAVTTDLAGLLRWEPASPSRSGPNFARTYGDSFSVVKRLVSPKNRTNDPLQPEREVGRNLENLKGVRVLVPLRAARLFGRGRVGGELS
jgi:hypothetical protein